MKILPDNDRATGNSVTITFEDIPCGSRRGRTSYDYQVMQEDTGEILEDALFHESLTTFADIDRDINTITVIAGGPSFQNNTLYKISVRGVNNRGNLPGPFGTTLARTTYNFPGMTVLFVFQ